MGTKYILKIHLAVILSWLHKMPPDKDSLQTKKDLSASEDYNNSFNAMEKSHSEVAQKSLKVSMKNSYQLQLGLPDFSWRCLKPDLPFSG